MGRTLGTQVSSQILIQSKKDLAQFLEEKELNQANKVYSVTPGKTDFRGTDGKTTQEATAVLQELSYSSNKTNEHLPYLFHQEKNQGEYLTMVYFSQY